MKFQRRYGKRKRSNPKRGMLLVLLLLIVLLIWHNADGIIGRFFGN